MAITRKQEDDLDTIEQGKPYIRSIVALVIYLVFKFPIPDAYKTADKFIKQLDEDVEESFK